MHIMYFGQIYHPILPSPISFLSPSATFLSQLHLLFKKKKPLSSLNVACMPIGIGCDCGRPRTQNFLMFSGIYVVLSFVSLILILPKDVSLF